VWQVLRTFNAFGERWRTGRRSLPADNRRRECGSLFGLNKPPCSGQPAPGEQLARRQLIPPRRRRHNPRRAVALRHDPLLLRQRPAPPGTCRNNLEPRDLRNRRMVSHTLMSSPSARITQGGARRSDTTQTPLFGVHRRLRSPSIGARKPAAALRSVRSTKRGCLLIQTWWVLPEGRGQEGGFSQALAGNLPRQSQAHWWVFPCGSSFDVRNNGGRLSLRPSQFSKRSWPRYTPLLSGSLLTADSGQDCEGEPRGSPRAFVGNGGRGRGTKGSHDSPLFNCSRKV
jgi:hypothetical protein